MAELPADFDLKLMPDWLKEPPSKNPYADYEVRDEDRRGRGRGGEGFGGRGRDDRGSRPGGPRGPGGGRNERGAPRGDSRSKKPGGNRPGSQDKPPRRSDSGGPARREGDRDSRDRPPAAPATPPANVTIEFFPDEPAAASIAREIKSTHRAYSLFDLARMFLAKPERHRLKISTKSVAELLHQVGENGPITFDKAGAERAAFPGSRASFYIEESLQREAPKGNFTNVARCRANGQLLGPTNYHGYQPALRKLFEERFSRRMSFADFQREIEVVTDPALVEQWKEQSRTTTIYRLKPPAPPAEKPAPEASPAPAAGAEAPAAETPAPETEAAETPPLAAEATASQPEAAASQPTAAAPAPEATDPAPSAEDAPAAEAAAPEEPGPVVQEGPSFANLAEVEQHFRENYLPGLIRSSSSFQVTGETSRSIIDRSIASAVRQAWEQERGFPGQMMHHLRQQFTRAGLHVFKHRKRMQFVSLIRPAPMEGGSLSPSVAEILRIVQADPRCTRASLATAILGADEAAVDPARKSTLASDLRWLIDTGRVIEFSDGHLDLPLAPPKNEPPKPAAAAAPSTPAADTSPASKPEPASDPVPVSELTPATPETSPAPEAEIASSAAPSTEESPASKPALVPEPAQVPTSSPEPTASLQLSTPPSAPPATPPSAPPPPHPEGMPEP